MEVRLLYGDRRHPDKERRQCGDRSVVALSPPKIHQHHRRARNQRGQEAGYDIQLMFARLDRRFGTIARPHQLDSRA